MRIFKVLNRLKSIYLRLETTVIKFTLTITVRAMLQDLQFQAIRLRRSLTSFHASKLVNDVDCT